MREGHVRGVQVWLHCIAMVLEYVVWTYALSVPQAKWDGEGLLSLFETDATRLLAFAEWHECPWLTRPVLAEPFKACGTDEQA